MRKLLFTLALAPCLAWGSESLSLNGVNATYSVPNSAAFRGLSSFWIDLRIHGYTIAAGSCNNLVQVAGPTQIRLCDTAASGGGILETFDNFLTPGGVPNLANPPGIPIIGASQTNPMVLTLPSAPFASVMSPGSVVTIWGATDASCSGLNGNHTVTAVSGFAVTIDYNASGCTYTAGAKIYGQDVLMRLSVNLANNQLSGETWNVDGTGYTVVTQNIIGINPLTLPASGLQIGPAPANLSYMRWCQGTIPLNSIPPTSSLTAPCGSAPVLADFEFEGNLADSGPNRLSMSSTPGVTYLSTPVYAPSCNPGVQQAFRAGTVGMLDGSRSFPLDGGSTLEMEWQFVPTTEPGITSQRVHWTSTQASPFPTFDRFIAGPLNFQLTVTDGSNQSTVCMIHDGAVATDDNGNISFSDSRVAQILGPLTRWGNPNATWPWLDAIEKTWADKMGGFQGFVIPGGVVTDYVDAWNTAQTGTVDCFQGQTTCVGHGTSFQNVFCDGAGNTAADASINFVGWYAYNVANGGGGAGRRVLNVASCPSQTSLVLTSAWAPPSQSNMNFSTWTASSIGSWINSGANINYYDNVLAFYSMYYRTGIDSYLHYARWLADRWWTMPAIDRGNPNDCAANRNLCNNGSTFPRMYALTGMYLRALDQDNISGVSNSSPMWPGIRMLTDGVFRYSPNLTGLIGDLRENSFVAMYVALCAAYDPDPVHAASCRIDVASLIDNVWKPARFSDGSWKAFTAQYTNVWTNWPDSGNIGTNLTVTVQPGSNIVTMSGGTWNPSWFQAGSTFMSLYNFNDHSTLDSRTYQATFLDSTHISIYPAYADNCAAGTNSCSGRSWAISQANAWTGFGTQPYMLGIAGHWFNQASIALSLDPRYAAEAALAQGYVLDAANWVSKSTLDGSGGADPAARGALYGVGFGVCTPGTDTNGCRCGPNNGNCSSVAASRENTGEALGALAIGYAYSPSTALQAAVDNVFSAAFAKNPGDPGYDGTYASDLDGFFLQTNNPKWFGFFWGMGRNAAYLSTRQGGLISPVYAVVQVDGDIGSVPGAAKIRVIATDPNGQVSPAVTCSSVPCPVTINKVTGAWTIQVQYLSATGSVISSGQPFSYPVK